MSESDNVTPLRPPEPRKPLFDVRDPKSQTILVYALTVMAFGINWIGNQFVAWIGLGLGVAALAIAASKRDEGPFWARSHFEFALRTIIIAAVAWTIVSIIGVIPILGWIIAWLVKPIVMIWVVVRAAVGFLRASETKVIDNPVTWLI
ncbi:MAG: hypothetical protein NW200_11845 [Hyphomonadaceae bacterium]|nr:hypothetical protein [Hyphomonadaceae bacterium]